MSCHQLPETNNATGAPRTLKSDALNTSAAAIQSFRPLSNICAQLNAWHTPYDKPGSCVINAFHFCSHLNEDIRQCLLYDSPERNARLIGVEYMVSRRIFDTLDPEERKLWHSHCFEVKSGQLIMPGVPILAENEEMKEVMTLYGKVYHMWHIERGDKLPLGKPELMTSTVDESSFECEGGFEAVMDKRDGDMGLTNSWRDRRQAREGIEDHDIHPDADAAWKKN